MKHVFATCDNALAKNKISLGHLKQYCYITGQQCCKLATNQSTNDNINSTNCKELISYLWASKTFKTWSNDSSFTVIKIDLVKYKLKITNSKSILSINRNEYKNRPNSFQ